MKQTVHRYWRYWRYRINGLLLILPFWFLYDALTPQLPSEWPQQTIGPFTAAPTPADNNPPYAHDGGYLKDFSVRFCDGCVAQIRNAYLNVGATPTETPHNLDGLLHGTSVQLHVHAPFPTHLGSDDRLWLTVQEWNGQLHHSAWEIPR